MVLGRTIDEVLELPEREIRRWWLYWTEEPWGPYRDNWHAAQLCAAVLAPHMREGSRAAVRDFMFEHPDDTKQREREAFIASLDSTAARGKKKK